MTRISRQRNGGMTSVGEWWRFKNCSNFSSFHNVIIYPPSNLNTTIFQYSSLTMPVHPSEEEAPTGLTEKIAKDPSSTTESTASEHESHQNEHTPGDSLKASAQDFQSKGPQIPMSMDGMSFWEIVAHDQG